MHETTNPEFKETKHPPKDPRAVELGRKGGKAASGAAKRRGDKPYYQRLQLLKEEKILNEFIAEFNRDFPIKPTEMSADDFLAKFKPKKNCKKCHGEGFTTGVSYQITEEEEGTGKVKKKSITHIIWCRCVFKQYIKAKEFVILYVGGFVFETEKGEKIEVAKQYIPLEFS